MRRLAALGLTSVMLAAGWSLTPAGAATPGAATRGEIAGRAVTGPTCPVEQSPPNPECAPRPIRVTIRITSRYAKPRYLRTRSDGRFSVALAPGTYTVRGLSPRGSSFPRPPAPQRGRVRAGHIARITLVYDTGIR